METEQTIRLETLQEHLLQYDEILQAAIEDSETDIIGDEIEHEWHHFAIDQLEQSEQITTQERKDLQFHHALLQEYHAGICYKRGEQQNILTTKIIVKSVRHMVETIVLFSELKEMGIGRLKVEIEAMRKKKILFELVLQKIQTLLGEYRIRNRICVLDVFQNIDCYVDRTIQLLMEDDVDEE